MHFFRNMQHPCTVDCLMFSLLFSRLAQLIGDYFYVVKQIAYRLLQFLPLFFNSKDLV
jgi:hypothetical protein